MTGIYIGLVLYIAVNFGLSIWSGRSQATKSAKGFVVGNRGYGSVMTAFAMGTTLASGFAFIGMVGMGYTMGIMATWQCIFGTILEFCCWYFLAKKCRELSIETGSVTPTELLSRLHGDPGNWIKIIGGLFIGLFMVLYLAGQFNAGAVAAEAIGLDAFYVSVAVAVLTMLFIFLGGVNAAMWTNAIQGIIMILAFVIMLVIALSHVGGLTGLFSGLSVTAPELIDWRSGRTSEAAVFFICTYWFGSAVGFIAQPQGIQKFLTLKNNKSARTSALMSCVFNIIRQMGPVLIGMCCRLIYPDISNPDAGIPTLVVSYLPNILGGIVIAGIFAAIMSTTEGLLLQAVAELNNNFLRLGILAKSGMSEKLSASMNKIFTIVLTILALLVSISGSGAVFDLIIFAWTGLAAVIGPALFLGLYWKKCTSQGILAGVITSIPACAFWYYCIKGPTGFHEAFSLIVPILSIIIVSLMTQKVPQLENYAEKAYQIKN